MEIYRRVVLMKCKYCKTKISFTDWICFERQCWPCYNLDDYREVQKLKKQYEDSEEYWSKVKK